jgi:hypothetical protein
MLNSALKMVRSAQEEIDINDFDTPGTSIIEKSKLRTILLSLGPASILSGVLLITLVCLRPSRLLQDLLICLGVFISAVGLSAVCIVRGTDVKINKAITRASR